MPDIQMILDAPQAMQGAAPAPSQGADGGAGDLFGKALNQAKTSINNDKAPWQEGQQGKKEAQAPQGPASRQESQEKAGGAKGHKAKARHRGGRVPNLPTHGAPQKLAANQAAEKADAGQPGALAKTGGASPKTRSEAWAEIGAALPDSLSEGTPIPFWRGPKDNINTMAAEGSVANATPPVAQQAANDGAGAAPPDTKGQLGGREGDVRDAAPADVNTSAENGGPDDAWLAIREANGQTAGPDAGAGGAEGQAPAEGLTKMLADMIAAAWGAEEEDDSLDKSAAEADGEGAAAKAPADARKQSKSVAEMLIQQDEIAEIVAGRGRKGQSGFGPNIEKQGGGPNDAAQEAGAAREEARAKAVAEAKAQTKAEARAQEHAQGLARQAENKSLAEAGRALGLRQEAPSEDGAEKPAPAAHFRHASAAPIEIESALPRQDKGTKAQEQAAQAKEALEGGQRADRAEAEDASAAKAKADAAAAKRAKADIRAAASEAEGRQGRQGHEKIEGQSDKARAEGHGHLQPKGAAAGRDAEFDAAARRASGDAGPEAKGARGAKDAAKEASRARRQAIEAQRGHESVSEQAKGTAKAAPPPMRMDAAPQSRADESAKAGHSGHSPQAGHGGQSAQSPQSTQGAQGEQPGGQGSQHGQNSQNSQSGQGDQSGQHGGQGAAGAGPSRKGFEAAEKSAAWPGDALAKPSDGSPGGGHAAAATDSKPAFAGGAQPGVAGQAAPALPGALPGQQAQQASVARPPLPPQAPMAQLDGSVKWLLRNQQQAAEIQLYPEHLGKVTIRLRVEGNEVHARVWASEASTLPVLREQRAHLESSLKEQGLQLSSFDLQHGKGGQQANSEGQNRPQGQNFHFGAQMIESWNGSEFRQELPTQAPQGSPQGPALPQDNGRVELYA